MKAGCSIAISPFRGSADRGRIRFHVGVSFAIESSFNVDDGRETNESVADVPEPHGAAARQVYRRLNCPCWSACWSGGCIQGDGGANS